MNELTNNISGRLSLREPQRVSLEILSDITGLLSLGKDIDTERALNSISQKFPAVVDFERAFPSLCFALATGVGKTRLIGAFISYLHLSLGIENFFVLAPNLTIYNKLIDDFTPGTSKYVFKGISQFAVTPPTIITGDNYNELSGTLFDEQIECRVNVFNISKINSEVRGGKAPKIKQLSEYIGQSYFDYLSSLPDLVLLMDESHRYRATAGIRAINELKPILGLELTATPFVETNKGPLYFRNIVYNYSLAQAMADGFVKEPAVVTRKDFSTESLDAASLEDIKLKDGIILHDRLKVELQTYAIDTGKRIVKPLLLVIARDTVHASQLLRKIQSDDFSNGNYKDKVIQVDSSTKEDEVVERLLKVEDPNEPTEIVIHVNMLKEGWDVNNLYTIVPLRAANARTLIEQSIGRGLRLPYGKRTGVPILDTLNIVAHDKFQEIIDESRKVDSPIKMKSILLDDTTLNKKVVTVISKSVLEQQLVNNQYEVNNKISHVREPEQVFRDEKEREIAQLAFSVIKKLENKPEQVPTVSFLKRPEIREQIINEVKTNEIFNQRELDFEFDNKIYLNKVIDDTISLIERKTINIPQILEVPIGELKFEITPFQLDLSNFNFHKVSDDLWIQELRTGKSQTISHTNREIESKILENVVVNSLLEYDDISYEENSDLLFSLAKQVVDHFRWNYQHGEIYKILIYNKKKISTLIYEQLLNHSSETSQGGFDVKVIRGFTELKQSAYTTDVSEIVEDFQVARIDKNNISKYLFTGFSRCLYSFQKFDSDPERILAIILDRDSQKWFRPVAGQLSIYYRKNGYYGQYEPDFIVETSNEICILEVKKSTELEDSIVVAKKDAALRWCKLVSDYSLKNEGKKWVYALIPHDYITENKTLDGLISKFGEV